MINRSKMRRQLYMGGGIAGIYPRKKFGLGSDIKDRFRKLIPNELADVAAKAAPVVAPFSPATAALMRGIGRFDKRGSISDALKQGALTYGFGKYVAPKIPGTEEYFGKGMEGARALGTDVRQGLGKLFQGGDPKPTIDPKKRKGLGIVQKGVDFITSKAPILKKLPDNVAQKLLVGGAISGATALASYFKGDFREQEEGESIEEYLAARKDAVGKQMRIYMDNYFKFDPEYSQLDAAGRNAFVARYNVAQGGRIGYRIGTPEAGIKSLEAGASDITYEGNEGPQAPMKMVDMEQIAIDFKREHGWDMSLASPEMIIEYIKEWKAKQNETTRGPVLPEDPTKPINPFAPKPTGPVLPDKMMAAKGGRIGYSSGSYDKALTVAFKMYKEQGGTMSIEQFADAWVRNQTSKAQGGRIGQLYGTGPAGLPGIPRQAPDGMEFDMRENGGFQPLGAKEKKDDVPAMLAKNEFVFTADAVRGAGGGDIELGAQRMYDTMKNLEKRVV